jgi:hypothetical protein
LRGLAAAFGALEGDEDAVGIFVFEWHGGGSRWCLADRLEDLAPAGEECFEVGESRAVRAAHIVARKC